MPAIEINRLTKTYGHTKALDDLSLTVDKGEIFGYLGPNGSGKTTTIRLMLGMIKPTAGSILINGYDAQTQKQLAHRQIAYVPGESNLWPFLSGEETLHLLAKVHGQCDVKYRQKLIKDFDLLPNKKVRTYSKGNKQKIALIAALASRADILIMDEPTAGLDPLMEQVFRQTIREAHANNQTVFLSSHILDEVEALCDRVALLRSGRIEKVGTLEELRSLSALKIEASFKTVPPDVRKIKGVSRIVVSGNHLSCEVHGPMEDLLGVLSKAKPVSLLSRAPSLEELFVSMYETKDRNNDRHDS